MTQGLRKQLSFLFLCISVLAVLLPLMPIMPSAELDPSWSFASNQAVGQHLVFGRDVVFTSGPYSSIYTKQYHPATDMLALSASAFVAVCYIRLLALLLRNSPAGWTLVFGLLFSIFMDSRDVLLYSYTFLLSLLSYRLALSSADPCKVGINVTRILWTGLLFVPLGLFPLVKLSQTLLCAASTGICTAMFIYGRKPLLAAIAVLSAAFGCILFWMLAAQPIAALPDYFLSALPIVSGYTESMQLAGKYSRLVLFVMAASLVMLSVLKTSTPQRLHKLFLFLIYFVFLFVSFKTGFVRQSAGHMVTAATALVVAILSLHFVSHKSIPVWLIAWVLLSSWAIGKKHMIHDAYTNAWEGILSRMHHELPLRYAQSLDQIRSQYSIPALEGSTDIYAYHQSYLLASQNHWAPRPVLQSYSAYTESLALRDADYLSGANAPDNILFCVETIDDRFPALDDGASWLVLMQRYELTHQDDLYLYLKKRAVWHGGDDRRSSIMSGNYRLGQTVFLPDDGLPLFAELDINPTVLGHILSFLYKPPALYLRVELANGENKKFRIASSTAKARFLISPLVETTGDFSAIFRDKHSMANKRVRSIAIMPEYGDGLFWSKTYQFHLGSPFGQSNE